MLAPVYQYRATVTRIVDGDTLDMTVDLGFRLSAQLRFRLMNYNAPEARGPERAMGRIATQALESICPVGATVLATTYKGDAFGRYLADIQFGGVDIASLLTERGFGVRWDGRGDRPAFVPGEPYPGPPVEG